MLNSMVNNLHVHSEQFYQINEIDQFGQNLFMLECIEYIHL
jgi:hypothetical protein